MVRLSSAEARRLGLPVGSRRCSAKASRRRNTPHERLCAAVESRFGARVKREVLLIPGRRYRGDLVIEDARLIVEIDGWQHHGLRLADFKRDRARQNLLVLHGWRVLRYFPARIYRDLPGILEEIARAADVCDRSNETRATGKKEKTKISRKEFEAIQLLAMDAAEKVFAARAARLRFVREPGDERFSKVLGCENR